MVAFYDGEPTPEGQPFEIVDLDGETLAGGSTFTVTLSWTPLDDGQEHIVYAVVDELEAVEDSDRSNNTARVPVRYADLTILDGTRVIQSADC